MAKSDWGVTLTPHPLLVPWSRKDSAIPLLLLWAVRPVQSLSACTRVHFTLHAFTWKDWGKLQRNVRIFRAPSKTLPRFESEASWIQVGTSSLVSLCEKIIMCSSVNELGAIALWRELLYKLQWGCVQWGGTRLLRRTAAALSPPDRPPRCRLIQADGSLYLGGSMQRPSGSSSIKSPSSGPGTLSLDWCHKWESARNRDHVYQWICAVRAVEEPVFSAYVAAAVMWLR
jgi:hypothetical protein